MNLIASDGASIAFDELGRGEPALLMLPGWCTPRTVFQDLLPRLASRRRTLALDWRGHGESPHPAEDFDSAVLVEDALAVVEASSVDRFVPVALSHAGWLAIELRRRLGTKVAGVVFLDWIVTEAPPPFLAALEGMKSRERWRETLDAVFQMWINGVDRTPLIRFVHDQMGSFEFEMWARAAHEIGTAYRQGSSPLHALAGLEPAVEALHLYAQPDDPAYLDLQHEFAREHPWFQVQKLEARSHLPMFEIPDQMATSIERFAASL